MKLRNKKTGKIQEIVVMPVIDGYPDETVLVNGETSLKEFNKVWEDYEPKEPLIKDENIRKAVRSWAEVNSIKTALYSERPNKSLCQLTDMGDEDYDIQFVGWIPTLKDGEVYIIAELCGDKE